MTRRWWFLVTVLAVALVVTSVGWIRASDSVQLAEDAPSRFDRCTFDGSRLVLTYSYGANERIAPSVDTRGRDRIVVELGRERGEGATVAIGLTGQAEFLIYGGDPDDVIEYSDGKRLECDEPPQP